MSATAGPFEGEQLLGSAAPHRLLHWYLGRIASDNADGLAEEVASLFTPEVSPAVQAGFMLERFDDLRGFRLLQVVEESDTYAIVLLETPAGVRWRAGALTDSATGAFRRVGSAQAPGPGVTVRRAEPSDTGRIAEMVRTSPITAAHDTLLLDYGDDYLAATAMADDRVTLIAERDGIMVGLHGLARVDLRYHEEILRFGYIRHTRVAPTAKGSGIFSALNGALFELNLKLGGGPVPMSLVVLANDAMLSHLPAALRTWGTPWERFHLDTVELANGAPSPPVDDLEKVASLITLAQGEADLAVVVSAASLTDRLARAPTLYSSGRLRGNGDAVLGVGAQSIIVRRTGSNAGAHREAVAYDVGMAPGASSALIEVVRGWCSALAAEGIERLTVACGTAAPVRDVLKPLASEHERFLLNCALTPPQATVASLAFDNALM